VSLTRIQTDGGSSTLEVIDCRTCRQLDRVSRKRFRRISDKQRRRHFGKCGANARETV